MKNTSHLFLSRSRTDGGKEMLKTYANYIPAEQRINIFEIINSRFKGSIDAFIDECFEHSIFGNPKNFEKFIKKPSLYKIGYDWMILFKYSITDGILKTAIAMKEANQNYNAAHKVWVKGMMDMRKDKRNSYLSGRKFNFTANLWSGTFLRTVRRSCL